jgi:hypothetical protein
MKTEVFWDVHLVTDVLREGIAPFSGSSNPRRVTAHVGLFEPLDESTMISSNVVNRQSTTFQMIQNFSNIVARILNLEIRKILM